MPSAKPGIFRTTLTRLCISHDSAEKTLAPLEDESLPDDGARWSAKPDVIESEKDLVTKVIHADDDPLLNPWTFRMWFIGTGLDIFGAIMETIYFFRPVTLDVSNIFLALLSYIFGTFLEWALPKTCFVGRWFNPHPVNMKEHAAMVVIASSGAQTALAVEVIAVQRLFYDSAPNFLVSILVVVSSQCVGYGFAGLLRRVLLYPTKMVWPSLLPMNTLLETLHRDRRETRHRLRFFLWILIAAFFWEVLPECVMPILTSVSVFCLAKQDSLIFTNIFGGFNGNEGLGVLSLGLDWQSISSKPWWTPLATLTNSLVGYIICIFLFLGVYYGNVWRAQDFPFLSQLLFSQDSTSSNYVLYNQTEILNDENVLLPSALETEGLPFFAGTYAMFLFTTNLAVTATISHLLLWNWDDLKTGYSFLSPSSVRSRDIDGEKDPHYQLMLRYPECPSWWYTCILILSVIMGLIAVYTAKSTLPWYGFFASLAVAGTFILFFGAQIVQMIGGYLHPGQPLANMHFTLFGYNSVIHGISMVQDLKFGQYAKLPPKATFCAQVVGTLVGAVVNYIMMVEITTNQRDILLSIQGTNIWSGQNIQQFNSQAIAWGALAKEMFSPGSRYGLVPIGLLLGFFPSLIFHTLHRAYPIIGFSKINTPIILAYAGILSVGISSSMISYFAIGLASQFWLRRWKPDWFVKYNYVLAAALDGGTQILVFLFTVSESPTKERDTVADPPNPFIRRIPTRLDQRHLDHDASHAVRNEQHRPLLILLSSQCVEVFQECIGQLAKSRPFDHVGVTICSIGLPPDALPHQG
ncbi:OPT oligopeptide transporter protein-domain-containing protein [Fusarium solani]|uniref:OPT oligopeptide transporter protein-domain-containing protein n=1 Tax=Fusarium solani TaxID=169388 RepID=A0A9P9G2L7_FUSSL|nr:OPT oligopeptide transporter protein-domain-containing protein [Fusarium solani]KAH7231979.1 OPT oligopeptide transporter protein-domain-containing protein [Fusarium solani]